MFLGWGLGGDWSLDWNMAVQARAFQDNLLGFPPCGNSQGLFTENGINGGNGCGLNFNNQQLLQKQLQQQRNQNLSLDVGRNNGVVDRRFAPTVSQPPSLQVHAQIDQQGREIDQYIRLQVSNPFFPPFWRGSGWGWKSFSIIFDRKQHSWCWKDCFLISV